jgi:hypothetical protein
MGRGMTVDVFYSGGGGARGVFVDGADVYLWQVFQKLFCGT